MDTKEKIVEAAKKEFIEKGFAEASLRNIASKVGISAAALYRHYANKEEIFEAVIEPAVQKWNDFCNKENIRKTTIASEQGLEGMWDDKKQFGMIVDFIYENFAEQKLLFCGSEGSKYAGFFHELITKVQDYTLCFMKKIEKAGIHVNWVDEREMHLILSAQYSAIREILEHDFSYQEARHYADIITMFFAEGWRSFLGF